MVRGADARPAMRRARTSLGPAGRTYPLSDAVTAVAEGIERRAPIVVVPGYLKAMLALRGILTPVIGRLAAKRYPQFGALVDEEAARFAAEGSAAVGPGGRRGCPPPGSAEASKPRFDWASGLRGLVSRIPEPASCRLLEPKLALRARLNAPSALLIGGSVAA